MSSAAGAAARGALAGSIGTLAMDLLWYSRYRRKGGSGPFHEWEITRGLSSWDDAPAPARMGRKLIRGATGHDVAAERAAALSNVMHWGYGISWASAYGLIAGRRGAGRRVWHGPALGAVICSSDYVVLPLAGVYDPIWKYDARTLYEDLSAHVLFGTVADAALRVLAT